MKKENRYQFMASSQRVNQYAQAINSYLDSLVAGDGKKSYCPFVKRMQAKDLFFYDISQALLIKEEFLSALAEMEAFLTKVADPLAVVSLIYVRPENYDPGLAQEMERLRQAERTRFIRQGLTIAWTHPANPMGTHTDRAKPYASLWISDVPMLLLRRLHQGDEPFMLTMEQKKAFIVGLKYDETIPVVREDAGMITLEEKLNIILAAMAETRLSTIASIMVTVRGDLLISKKDDVLKLSAADLLILTA